MSIGLEDHLGDILRKARQAARLTPAAVAQIARVPETDWSALEASGQMTSSVDLAVVAPRLGLAPGKLQAIADGWMPQVPDLTQWRELRILSTARQGNTVNCFLVWDEVIKEAALFDTGWDSAPVVRLLEEHGLQLRHLFLTHLHQDHVAALDGLRERFPKVHLHASSKTVPPQHRNRANDFIHLGNLRITNREVPGHAAEGVIYIIGNWPDDAPHIAVVGDTIFAGSIASGFQSWELLKEKIQEQIFSLPEETLLCPGHGPPTTLAQEKAHNPFF